MCLAIAGHLPDRYPLDPKPLGVGAPLPDHRRRVGDGAEPKSHGNRCCGYCGMHGHRKVNCPERER